MRPTSFGLGLISCSALDAELVARDHKGARQAQKIEWVARRERCRNEVDDITAMRSGRDGARDRDAVVARVGREDERVVAAVFERSVALIGHIKSIAHCARTVVDVRA